MNRYSTDERHQTISALIEINPEVDKSFFSDYVNSGSSECFVMEKGDDEVLGYICVTFYDDSFNLDDIIIDDNYRSMGYGRMFLDFLVNTYMDENNDDYKSDAMTLECNNTNISGLVFYIKYGFIINGFIYGYYGGSESAVCMMYKKKEES